MKPLKPALVAVALALAACGTNPNPNSAEAKGNLRVCKFLAGAASVAFDARVDGMSLSETRARVTAHIVKVRPQSVERVAAVEHVAAEVTRVAHELPISELSMVDRDELTNEIIDECLIKLSEPLTG